ncbi:MAG TPA: cation transporter [Acidimicrobiales bacterium]|nr:cation transporter [Acidimicrobiales bacterium]
MPELRQRSQCQLGMMAAAGTLDRARLHRRALWLETFTIAWNVIEAIVAVGAGVASGSVALVGFGVDSAIEVASALGLFWRLRRAGPEANAVEESDAERKALYIVAATFFALAAYILYESFSSLLGDGEPDSSTVGVVLAVLSLAIMPMLASAKQRTGEDMGSRALQADAIETWVCSYLSLALLLGVGLHATFGWPWADPLAALAMLPVILYEGWETVEEARKRDGDEGDEGER